MKAFICENPLSCTVIAVALVALASISIYEPKHDPVVVHKVSGGYLIQVYYEGGLSPQDLVANTLAYLETLKWIEEND